MRLLVRRQEPELCSRVSDLRARLIGVILDLDRVTPLAPRELLGPSEAPRPSATEVDLTWANRSIDHAIHEFSEVLKREGCPVITA